MAVVLLVSSFPVSAPLLGAANAVGYATFTLMLMAAVFARRLLSAPPKQTH